MIKQKYMKKVFLVGLLSGFLMMILGMAIGQLFYLIDPSLISLYEDTNIFRSMDDPIMSLFMLYPILQGIILSWIWTKTAHLIKVEKPCKKAVIFGLIYWLVTSPTLIINISSFAFPVLAPISWSLTMGLQGVLGGLIYARMLK